MAKNLMQSTRIHVYGGADHEKRAFSLIGFDSIDNDSVVALIRGEVKEIPRLLKQHGLFTEKDIEKVMSMKFKETWWIDNYGLIVRIA